MLANMLSLVIFGNRVKKRLGVLNKTKVKLRCKLIPVCFFSSSDRKVCRKREHFIIIDCLRREYRGDGSYAFSARYLLRLNCCNIGIVYPSLKEY